MNNFKKIQIESFIESYFQKHFVEIPTIWDRYILNYEGDKFTDITVYYHTYVGDGNIKIYTPNVVTIPYIDII